MNKAKVPGARPAPAWNALTQFNAVIFHDVPGSEYVQVHSETHAMTNTESDHFEYVPDTHYSFHGSF